MEFTAQQIAEIINGSIEGDPNVKVSNFSRIEEGQAGTITFLANPKYEHYIYNTQASIVLVNDDFTPTSKLTVSLIRVPNAYNALASLLKMVEKLKKRKVGISSTAHINETASLGEGCYVGEMAYIGANAVIGKNCLIYPQSYIGDDVTLGDETIVYPHVTIYDECHLGKRCIVHAGAVIGSDGFGFAPEGESYNKIPQLGNVIIEDDVEIGANTTLDRAVMGSTRIKKGVKLDNLIQVAHNVTIGENTVMAAQVGIAGSTKVGRQCMFGGQVGLGGHLDIGDHVKIGAQAGLISNVKDHASVMGSPAIPVNQFFRSSIVVKKLPEVYHKIIALEKELEELKKTKISKDA